MNNVSREYFTYLKGCPFCGSYAYDDMKDGKGWFAQCADEFETCDIMPCAGFFKTNKEACDAWNKRIA